MERLRVAKLIDELPLIREAMMQGELSFSAVRELTRVATAETEGEWLTASREMNQRELEELVSGHKRGNRPTDRPDPAPRWKDLHMKVRPETYALMRQAQQILGKERGERLDEDEYLSATARLVIDGIRPALSPAPAPRSVAPQASSAARASSSTPASTARASSSESAVASSSTPPSTAPGLSAAVASSSTPPSTAPGSSSAVASSSTPPSTAPGSSAGSSSAVASSSTSTAPASSSTPESSSALASSSVARFAGALIREQIEPIDADVGSGSMPLRTRAPYQIAVTVCRECKRGWQDGGGITVEMTPAAIERAWCDAEIIGSVEAVVPERAKQAIPPSVRRLVWARDHGRCRVPGCRSSMNLDVHHIEHQEDGGTHESLNLILLCEGHHLAHHAGNLIITGTASQLVISRRASSSFTAATRVVETAKALATLGYSKREAREAAEQTRTHVGTADWSIEAWIKHALSKCPRS
ncbi:MAG: hypothetical protein HOV81_37695 [Kofleriaceae bacterium]|nr:hypothetical protein [Kofleriaceae bacterium]